MRVRVSCAVDPVVAARVARDVVLSTQRTVIRWLDAGTGKTHVLNLAVAYLKHDRGGVAITASTGIAACHVGGVTLHSWAGCGVPVYIGAWCPACVCVCVCTCVRVCVCGVPAR